MKKTPTNRVSRFGFYAALCLLPSEFMAHQSRCGKKRPAHASEALPKGGVMKTVEAVKEGLRKSGGMDRNFWRRDFPRGKRQGKTTENGKRKL